MSFEGLFIATVEEGGAIELPRAWLPDDGGFCAFLPSRTPLPCVAVHPIALVDMMRQSLPEANRLTGSSMGMMELEVKDGRLILPVTVTVAIGLRACANLVGKGGHFLVIDHSACSSIVFLPPTLPRQ
jgi:hypothetical protein